MKKSLLTIILAFVTLMTFAQTADEWHSMKSKINILVANDMGRNGYYDQKPIAETMGEVAGQVGPECVIAAGDIHHFNGITSTSDPLWMTNYELIYSHPELMLDWYAICGNHEYRGNTKAFIDYGNISRRWMMREKYYTLVYRGKDGSTLRIVMIDTTPLIEKYRKDSAVYPDACHEDDKKQLAWIDATLANAHEDWVVVVGHHPMYADTGKEESERIDMQHKLLPILKKHKNVAMYVCGHIHNFQHIRKSGDDIDYVVNSSASLARPVAPIEGTQFCSDEPGFSVVTADKASLNLYMLDKAGKILHRISRHK